MRSSGRLRYTARARADLVEIRYYVARESGGQRAAAVLQTLQKRLAMVEAFPLAGPARDDLMPGIRIATCLSYVIFYSIDDRGPLIERIPHGARDLDAIFQDLDDDA